MKTGEELNLLVREANAVVVSAGVTIGESCEIFARCLCGAAMQACDGDRERAAALLRSQFVDIVQAIRDKANKWERVS